jgi:non-homologous end joining protein Ku
VKDKYQERVIEFILNRCQSTLAATGSDETPRPTPVLNIAEALRKSIDLVRKPPATDPGAQSPKKGKDRKKG